MSGQMIVPCTCSNRNPDINPALLFLFLHLWLWQCCPPGDVGSRLSPMVCRELGLNGLCVGHRQDTGAGRSCR